MPADPTTRLIHHPYRAPGGFDAPQPGVFKASTVFFPSVAAMRSRQWMDKSAYTYGLHGTPTSYLLEERLCALEGGLQCLLVPSGLAALGLVALSLLKSGDEVLLADNVYTPNKSIVEGELAGWGITHQYYNPMDPADLESRITSKTRLVWLEAAGSVTLEFPDIVALVRICKRHKVWTALDNTWGAGLAFEPFNLLAHQATGPEPDDRLGVDITAHALTKYPSGGADVLMGSIITREPALHQQLKLTHMRLGLGVGMNDVETVLRSLPTMALRYRAQDEAARALAQWAQTQAEFVQVLHPALAGSPGHAHWQALCGSGSGSASDSSLGRAAGLFSVVMAPTLSQAKVDAFCDALRLFRLGYSWGGPVSLVVPYELGSMRTVWPPHLERGTLVRFATGLEGVDDLRADLMQALAALCALA